MEHRAAENTADNRRPQAEGRCRRPSGEDSPAAADTAMIWDLNERGFREEALEKCRRMLEEHPEAPELHFIMGSLLQSQGRLDQAAEAYRRALGLDPHMPETHYNLGLVYQATGKPAEAENRFGRAAALAPRFAAAHNNLGALLMERGELTEAARCFEVAALLEPEWADAHFNAGRCAFEQKRYAEAALHFERAVELRPSYARAWRNLALAFQKLGFWQKALVCLQTALSLKPQERGLCFDMANLYLDADDWETVIEWYRRGVALSPGDNACRKNLARLLEERGRLAEALEYWREIATADPHDAETHFEMSLLLLRLGRLEEGWREYEWRLELPNWNRGYPWRLSTPRWRGEPFGDRTLLVHCEQGYGDVLQFARYLPLAKDRGGKILFEVPAPLARLMAGLPGVDELLKLSAEEPPNADFDLHASLLSLPGLLCPRPEALPCRGPYLSADRHAAAAWQVPSSDRCLAVGIVWTGSKAYVGKLRRSCPPELFLTLVRIPEVRLYSLQTEVSAEEVRHLIGGDEVVTHWGDRFRDFADTAAAMANLDLIITVDTAAAHLAGALGRPVWVLLPFIADWRWQLDRSDSPWYPTMRLFRQAAQDNWQGVFSQVATALGQLAARGKKTKVM